MFFIVLNLMNTECFTRYVDACIHNELDDTIKYISSTNSAILMLHLEAKLLSGKITISTFWDHTYFCETTLACEEPLSLCIQ